MSLIYLSHFLEESTPGYGGNQGFFVKKTKNMCCGDSCNQQEWVINNHIGTHIDCPKHFSAHGKTLSDYEPSFWVSSKVQMIEIPNMDNQLIKLDDYIETISKDTEFLIIKTGHQKHRGNLEYWNNGPGMSPCSGLLLREQRSNLKFIGFDFISLTSYQFRPEGRIAHKNYLDPSLEGNPILIVEDMKLDGLKEAPKSVQIFPLLVKDADGGQVTVVAEV